MDEKSDRMKTIKGMLMNTERFRTDIMEELNRLGENKETLSPAGVYPMAQIARIDYNYSPVYQFSYHGALPPYEGMSREYIKMIKNYYHSATTKSLDFLKINGSNNIDTPIFGEKVSILFAHFFSNLNIRDLDNRNKKFVIDAIKKAGVIHDDNWQELSLFDTAFLDTEGYNHLQVFVLPEMNLFDFIKELNENTEKYIQNKRFKKQFEQFQNY